MSSVYCMTNFSGPLDIVRLPKPENLRDQIHGDLLARIQLGEISHATRLVDTDIANRFGTSRMPAREALLQLTNEGYLVSTTRGFRVPSLTDQDIRDIFEVRKLLEPRAAGQAAGIIVQPALDIMEVALEQARKAADTCDLMAMIAANSAFRAGWLTAVRNERLSAVIARFADHVQVVRLETLKSAETQRYVANGLASILDAFEQRNALAVADRMSSFIGVAEETYFATRKLPPSKTPSSEDGT